MHSISYTHGSHLCGDGRATAIVLQHLSLACLTMRFPLPAGALTVASDLEEKQTCLTLMFVTMHIYIVFSLREKVSLA